MMEKMTMQIKETGASVRVSQTVFKPTIHIHMFKEKQFTETLEILTKNLSPKPFTNKVVKNNNSEIWTFTSESGVLLRAYITKAFEGYKGMYED